MKHFLLTYTLAPDYLDRRAAYRDAHLANAWAAVERGEALLGGALVPADEAMLLFQGENARAAEAFARSDPYVLNGIVTAWRVREWVTVVGAHSANPVR